MPTFKKKSKVAEVVVAAPKASPPKASPPRSVTPASEAQTQCRRLMMGGWKLAHIARAVGISSGAAFNWTKGSEAKERFLVQLRELPTAPLEGKPALNKLDHAPRRRRPAPPVSPAQTDLAEQLEAEVARRQDEASLHVSSDELNAVVDAQAAVESGSLRVTVKQVRLMAKALNIDPLDLLERMGQLRLEF